MTQNDFFKKLEERAQKYGFQLKGNSIRERKTNFLPLEAVSVYLTGNRQRGNLFEISREIGIDVDFAQTVNEMSIGEDSQSANETRIQNRLLRTVGLIDE